MPASNPRPKTYASAAERQAAYKARYAVLEVRLDPTTADTITKIAQQLDVPRAELLVQLVKHGLLNRNWGRDGLRSDLRSPTLMQGARVTPRKRAE